jgi:putative ABC transport system permease protein
MNLDALNEALEEGPRISGVHVVYDKAAEGSLFDAIKSTPQRHALAKFRESIARNIDMMVSIYVGLAVIMALGVVYNVSLR